MCAGRCIYNALLMLEEMDGEEGAGKVTAALQELSGMMCAWGRKVETIASSLLLLHHTWLSVSPASGEAKPPTPKSSWAVGSGPAHTAPAEATVRDVLQHQESLAPQG